MDSSKWTVAVIGPGGVGGLIGGLLARAGHRVVMVGRPETMAVLAADGVEVRSARFGDFRVAVQAHPTLPGPVDLCLVATKSTSLEAGLDRVAPERLGHGVVVPLLNGVDHMAVLRERYPADQVVAGAIRVESTRVAPGRIEHTSPFAFVDLASDTAPRDRVDDVADRLREAGLDVTVRADEVTLLWDKLALLAPLALLTTHAAAPVGEVRKTRGAELFAAAAEVVAVARAVGATIDGAAVAAMLERVPDAMKSSMQRDVEAGRPTELEAIGGAVLRAAERTGVPVPVMAGLVSDLRARELGAAARG